MGSTSSSEIQWEKMREEDKSGTGCGNPCKKLKQFGVLHQESSSSGTSWTIAPPHQRSSRFRHLYSPSWWMRWLSGMCSFTPPTWELRSLKGGGGGGGPLYWPCRGDKEQQEKVLTRLTGKPWKRRAHLRATLVSNAGLPIWITPACGALFFSPWRQRSRLSWSLAQSIGTWVSGTSSPLPEAALSFAIVGRDQESEPMNVAPLGTSPLQLVCKKTPPWASEAKTEW